MDFSYTEQQQELINSTLAFAEGFLNKEAEHRIRTKSFDAEVWKAAAEFGFAGLPVPEQWGGLGLGALDTMMMVEALGQGCSDLGLSFSLSAHAFANVVPVWRFGDASIHDRYLRQLATGALIAANAASEPGAGSDIHGMKTKAEPVSGGYRLNGQKCFVTNGPVADVFLTYAKTNPDLGIFGITAFLIHKDTPGLTVGQNRHKRGVPTSPWSDVYFDDCFVSLEQRVGDEGAGGIMFHDSMIWEKGCLFAAWTGAMKRVWQQALEHVKTRKQFGKPIGENQLVSEKIIAMKNRLDMAQLMLYRAGWLYDQGKDCEQEIAQSKIIISEAAVQSGLDAVQLFGGSGIEEEMGMDQLLLDALPSRIFSGTNEIQHEIIARKLGLRR